MQRIGGRAAQVQAQGGEAAGWLVGRWVGVGLAVALMGQRIGMVDVSQSSCNLSISPFYMAGHGSKPMEACFALSNSQCRPGCI